MVSYPPGHVWGIAVIIEPIPPALMRLCEQTSFLTIPDDMTELPDFTEGMILPVLDMLCVKCRLPWADVQWTSCAYDDPTQRDHLRGGMKNRAWRTKAAPGKSAEEIATRQQRETPALMQASRIAGLS